MIKKVFFSVGIMYFYCTTSMYGNPIILKDIQGNLEKINSKEWEKISSMKELKTKKLQPHIHQNVKSFLSTMLPELKKIKKQRQIRSISYKNSKP
jgi:glutamyl-tRNA reductase